MSKTRSRPRKPQPAKGPGPRRPGRRTLVVLLLLLLLCISAWGMMRILFLGPVMPVEEPASAVSRRPGPQAPVIKARPSKRPVGRRAASPSPSPPGGPRSHSRIAIVIDDMGYQRRIGARLINLELPLSFAFLPQAPFTGALCSQAVARGRDILLHLPMQPEDAQWDPGPGALFVDMNASQIREVLEQDLAALPGVIGVNNHMGSRFTRDAAAMGILLALLKERRLFFLDSLTTPASVGANMARRLGVPTLRRDVFLDNEQDERAINRQLALLIDRAQLRGWAVGIAHPKPVTLAVLAAFRPPAGMEVVPLHQLFTEVGRR